MFFKQICFVCLAKVGTFAPDYILAYLNQYYYNLLFLQMKKIFTTMLGSAMCLSAMNADAATVADVKVGGWFEGGYVTWTKEAGYSYNVYVSPASSTEWTKLDTELVREYSTYGRADAVGLTAGQYKFKVVPVQNSVEVTADAAESDAFTATAYDRGGFAHFKTACSTFDPKNGVGAYKNDGTLKAGAKVFYVTADNAKTITTTVKTGSKATDIATFTGFQQIVNAYQKGYDTTPIDFRIIGTVKAADMDEFESSAEGLQIKGKSSYSELNITIEGIGKDAAIHGFGLLIRNACSVELRNFAIMWCMDDAVSMDTDNTNIWVHNLDLFYGQPGSASDQKKGDGTLDIKADSKYTTMSYNHLWDNGKSSLCGMTSESGPNYLTYHHNWFDHSDSRHPRIRTMSVHVYNNYYDGNSKYGVGATTGSDVFVESNYFRNCKYPMLISLQGSDVHNGVGSSSDTKGTFSGEAGGSIKAYGNYMTGQTSFEPYVAGDATYSVHFDAYVVTDKSETVPSSVVSLSGSNTYSNFDTDASLMYTDYHVDAAEDVPSVVTGELGAGRCQHGDFTWTFGSNEDSNAEVITALRDAIQNYQSTLVGFFGQTISNGGATQEQGGSSNEGTGDSGTGNDNTGDTGNVVYDYFASPAVGTTKMVSTGTADAVKAGTVKINTNTNSVNSIAFSKSMTIADGAVSDYYITIAPASGSFKAGDTLCIAGAYSNSSVKASAIKVCGEASDSLFTTQQFVNGKTSADNPAVDKYVLTKDETFLYLGRSGATGTNITTLKVIRPDSADAIKEISVKAADADDRIVKYIKDGKLVIRKNGKLYNAVGAQVD